MSKKLFLLLTVLMSLSLIGIILVQAYFINNTIKHEEEQFNLNVKRALSYTRSAISDREYRSYLEQVRKILASGKKPDSTTVSQITLSKQNLDNNEFTVYLTSILEENFRMPSFFDFGDLDSIDLKQFTSRTQKKTYKTSKVDGNFVISPTESIEKVFGMDDIEKELIRISYKEYYTDLPIHERISNIEMQSLLRKNLLENNIEIDFDYAIYDKDLSTQIRSENFELANNQVLGVKVFLDNNNQSKYNLYVSFPDREKFILSSIIGMMLLSVIFTAIIIVAYTSTIYQLKKQRQISQIKTDFINNMTHEFKTPIATINLALDSIKNPQIINNEDKVKRYLNMIKEENKRMHAQVENVLRISKLEKNELNISKDRIKLHDIIQTAVAHISLIVKNRSGYIKTHLDALKSSVLANETHFTNVIVNMLDNAVKYSEDEPKIDIYTENIGTSILLKIQDQGNGMSKAVQKKIFEKFYREHTGDVHNVKGHGLGLAYVKRIVDDHNGHVSVESEKGKGSTFIIKLPLIT